MQRLMAALALEWDLIGEADDALMAAPSLDPLVDEARSLVSVEGRRERGLGVQGSAHGPPLAVLAPGVFRRRARTAAFRLGDHDIRSRWRCRWPAVTALPR